MIDPLAMQEMAEVRGKTQQHDLQRSNLAAEEQLDLLDGIIELRDRP